MSDLYSPSNLPPFQVLPLYAMPKGGDASVAVCAIPVATVMSTPWGATLTAVPGQHFHQAQDAVGDNYPNDEYLAYYERTGELPDDDGRVVFLRNYWAERGYPNVDVWEAKKVKPALVVGVCSGTGTFQTKEGPAPFNEGDVVLESPTKRGQMWLITAGVFAKKYGEVRIGTVEV